MDVFVLYGKFEFERICLEFVFEYTPRHVGGLDVC